MDHLPLNAAHAIISTIVDLNRIVARKTMSHLLLKAAHAMVSTIVDLSRIVFAFKLIWGTIATKMFVLVFTF